MKTKKFDEKLVLNKKTIANLSDDQLGNVKGGKLEPKTFTWCYSCIVGTDTKCY